MRFHQHFNVLLYTSVLWISQRWVLVALSPPNFWNQVKPPLLIWIRTEEEGRTRECWRERMLTGTLGKCAFDANLLHQHDDEWTMICKTFLRKHFVLDGNQLKIKLPDLSLSPLLSLSLLENALRDDTLAIARLVCFFYPSTKHFDRTFFNKDYANRPINTKSTANKSLLPRRCGTKFCELMPILLRNYFASFSYWQCEMKFHSIKISSKKVRTYVFCSSCFLTLLPSNCAPILSLHACLVNSLTSQLKDLPSLANMFLRPKHAALDLPFRNHLYLQRDGRRTSIFAITRFSLFSLQGHYNSNKKRTK